MSNSVICVDNSEDKKFGILRNSKFLSDIKEEEFETIKETVYRHNKTSVEKLIEYHPQTNAVIRITNYDYFNDKKVKSVEEFNPETGMKSRLTSYTLFKSITEFDPKTGKKFRTTNYDIKNENRKTSIYDFDIESEKIVRISILRPDGKTVSIIKEIDPVTGLVKRTVNYKKNSSAISSVSKYDFDGDKTIKTTFYYNTPVYVTNPESLNRNISADVLNKKVLDDSNQKKIMNLIDNLYKNKMSFSSISV